MSASEVECRPDGIVDLQYLLPVPPKLTLKLITLQNVVQRWWTATSSALTVFEMASVEGSRWQAVSEDGGPLGRIEFGRVLEVYVPNRLIISSHTDCTTGEFHISVLDFRLYRVGPSTLLHFQESPFANETDRLRRSELWSQRLDRLQSITTPQSNIATLQ